MDLMTVKLVALSLLGGISLALGFVPLKFSSLVDFSTKSDHPGGVKSFWKRTITSVLLCFGGGVLMATSFVHMLPEVRESIESTSYDLHGIPAAELVFCCGFFLIYFVEELVHCLCISTTHSHDEASVQLHRCAASDAADGDSLRKSPILGNGNLQSDFQTFGQDSGATNGAAGAKTAENGNSHSVTIDPINSANGGPVSSADHSGGHSHLHQGSSSSLRDFLTVLALSFHAIFEGLAIGLEDEVETVWTLFAAVATHKYVISFCVGLELVTVRTPTKLFSIYMAVFSLVSPIGVGVGMGISSIAGAGDAYTLTVAILQGLAGGTLIYVVIFEILQREKAKVQVSGIAQLAFVLIGFAALTSIEVFAGHHHHEHGHHHHEHEHAVESI